MRICSPDKGLYFVGKNPSSFKYWKHSNEAMLRWETGNEYLLMTRLLKAITKLLRSHHLDKTIWRDEIHITYCKCKEVWSHLLRPQDTWRCKALCLSSSRENLKAILNKKVMINYVTMSERWYLVHINVHKKKEINEGLLFTWLHPHKHLTKIILFNTISLI